MSSIFMRLVISLINILFIINGVQNDQGTEDTVTLPLQTLMSVTEECPRLQELGTKLLNDKEFCDINLEVSDPNTGEKRRFCAHKCILCLRSDVLKEKIRQMVSRGPAKPVLTLPDMNTEVFKNVLRFIYTDKIDSYFDLKHNLLDMYSIAHFLGLKDLKIMIEQYFYQNVDINDIGYHLKWIRKYKITKIKVFVLDFARHSMNMTKTDWNYLMENLCVSAGYVQEDSDENSNLVEEETGSSLECQEMFYRCTSNKECCSNYCMMKPDWNEGVCKPSYARVAKSSK